MYKIKQLFQVNANKKEIKILNLAKETYKIKFWSLTLW